MEYLEKDPCSGRYIYMYDLPAKFNKDIVKNCRAIAEWFDYCPYVENEGFGPHFNDTSDNSETVTTKESWFETNQFMLSMIFHHRMKKYKCLTRNSTLATAIYAPFYPGLEVRRYLDKTNLSLRDEGGVAFASWIRRRPEWRRFNGWDHFFVSGRISWDFRRLSYTNSSWGSKLLDLPESKNMTMLTIETSPYANNDFALPYPTYFHPSKDSEVFEWQKRVKNSNRRYLFAFGGAPRPNMTGSIREELIRQCQNATRNRCNLVNCKPGDEMCTNPAHFIEMYMKTDFCLQPPGDSSTRRSTFDSILAGCIPVYFHPSSAYIQYIWYFPKNYTKYSVFIPSKGIENRTVSVEEILSKYSKHDISEMRKEVIRLIPKVIYARNKLETIEDAFDIAVKRILDRIGNSTRLVKEGKVPYSEFPAYASWKYYMTGDVGKHEWDSYF
ncbi:putative xyloglucan galactosyltransferase GT12 [Silene latifolia]|uniref:putative xyloglucan galactosyltransferase GT12 n=1 Tax=Silene latifolia TaxID=37657 RepID=UPI003D778261